MLKQFFGLTVLFKFGLCQLNGEFWWLNEKLVKHTGVQPSLPVYEDLSEFDSDESAKIIFKDNNFLNDIMINNPLKNSARKVRKETQKDKFYPHLIRWPDDDSHTHVKKIKLYNYTYQGSLEELTSVKPTGQPEFEDKLIFSFPKEENFVWKDLSEEATAVKISPNTQNITNDKYISADNNITLYNDRISLNMLHNVEQSQNICTNLVKSECLRRNGTIYFKKDESKNKITREKLCCVLPLPSQEDISSKIYFPDMLKKSKRPKRSNDAKDENYDFVGHNQRKNLLVHKYAHRRQKPKPQIQTRITTPDYEYDDPYWNIKIKTPNQKKQESNTRFDYPEDDIEDYTVEIPRPGLTGIYSDYGQRPIWGVFGNGKEPPYADNDDYDEDDSGSFGYSTIDPRLVTTSKTKLGGRPQKLTTDSHEVEYKPESQTISYSSNPNFNVLKDFKLPNLMMKNSKSKISRTTTTESFADDDSEEVLLGGSFESYENHNVNQERQFFHDCGKAVKTENLNNNAGKQIGESMNGSHPWLALVVPTRKQNTVLCYATLIHPRAAITAADCVQRNQANGELTLIIGIWNLSERSQARSRVPSVRLHPQFKEGLSHNVALLYWKNPLRLSLNVQPACLGTPNLEDDCMFVGWGGFDQAIRPRSRWQRASIHTCQDHLSLNGVNIPSEAFCTTVQARSTVTGSGGSLICTQHGRMAAVGVAISRDSTLVMLPIYEWAMRAVNILQDN